MNVRDLFQDCIGQEYLTTNLVTIKMMEFKNNFTLFDRNQDLSQIK